MARTAPRPHKTQRQCHLNDYQQLATIDQQLFEIIRVCAGLSSDFLRRYQITGDEHCLQAHHHYSDILNSFKHVHQQSRQGSRIQRRLWLNIQKTPSRLTLLARQFKSFFVLAMDTYLKRKK